MIPYVKNTTVGFLVSFIGSLPLGYLNVVGYEICKEFGLDQTIGYLLGVVFVEFFVIYFTLVFAKKLMENQKLIQVIEGFSVVFMFVLAYVFYASATQQTAADTVLEKYVGYSPFAVGLFLSSINVIQIPFWTGWNLYLLNANYIDAAKSHQFSYVFGAVVGTFLGMLLLILSLQYLATQTDFFARYLMQIIIPLVFVVLGLFQAIVFYKKYRT